MNSFRMFFLVMKDFFKLKSCIGAEAKIFDVQRLE